MNGRPDRNGAGGAERRTYATRSPAQQPGSVDADELEATITEVVLAALDESEIPSLDVPTPAGDDIAALERELTDLADLRGKGIITLAEWLTARAGVQERLDAARAAHTSRAVDPSVERLVRDPGAARQAWPELDLENRRALIGLLIERVVVAPATRGRWTTLEERLDPANGGGIRWKA